MRIIHIRTILVLSLFFSTCKENSTTVDTGNNTANDYFPIAPAYQWTYNSNTYSDSGKTYNNFDVKIDTATFRNGVFLALKIRLAGNPQWYGIMGLKDSGNIVYSLTDNPPVADPFPLFRHTYSANEGIRESVTVMGVTYDAVRMTIVIRDNKTYSMWFAKGVGLIKDSSNAGISLFSDNNGNYNVVIKSSLVNFQK